MLISGLTDKGITAGRPLVAESEHRNDKHPASSIALGVRKVRGKEERGGWARRRRSRADAGLEEAAGWAAASWLLLRGSLDIRDQYEYRVQLR